MIEYWKILTFIKSDRKEDSGVSRNRRRRLRDNYVAQYLLKIYI